MSGKSGFAREGATPATGAGATEEGRRRGWLRLGLGFVLLGAVALRLVYAWPWPDGRRFWDERYSFMNVRSLYEEKTFEPARSYYPSPVVNLPPTLLVALSETLAARTGEARWDAIDDEQFLPAAYRWARGLQAVYGTLAVWLVYLAGARLFGRAEGYLAALLMAFMVWQIHAAGVFKPDALLTMTVLLALVAAVRQIQRPGWPRAVAAGLSIALAASAKLTGVMIAAPLAVVALALGRADRRYWRDLAIAGATSAIAFVALNPYWTAYPLWIRSLRDDYEMRAGWEQMSRSQVPLRFFSFVTSEPVFGRVLGVSALLAFGLLAWRALSRRHASRERASAALIVTFPIAFSVSYGLQSAYFKDNQFLATVPFLILALVWLAVSLWRRAWRGRSDRLARLWSAVALSALTVLAAGHGFLYVYRALVPTTLDRAKAALSRFDPTGRRIYLVEEGSTARGYPWERSQARAHNRMVLVPVESLSAVGDERLALADGWLSRHERKGFDETLRGRVEAGAKTVFSPRWLRARGPELELFAAPLRSLPPADPLVAESCGKGCLTGTLPRRRVPGQALAFSVRIPLRQDRAGELAPTLEVDGSSVRLLATQGAFQSERIPVGRKEEESAVKGPLRWVLRVPGAEWTPQTAPAVGVSHWRLWREKRGSGEVDEVGVGETVEPGQVRPAEKREGGDHQSDHQE